MRIGFSRGISPGLVTGSGRLTQKRVGRPRVDSDTLATIDCARMDANSNYFCVVVVPG